MGNNPQKTQTYGAVLSLYVTTLTRMINKKNCHKSSLIFDEFPTIYFNGIDNLIATARSNKIGVVLFYDCPRCSLEKLLMKCSCCQHLTPSKNQTIPFQNNMTRLFVKPKFLNWAHCNRLSVRFTIKICFNLRLLPVFIKETALRWISFFHFCFSCLWLHLEFKHRISFIEMNSP